MSDENIVITKGELTEIIKKRKLEAIEESCKETDGALKIDTDEVIIEVEAEKFVTIFEKIFVEETAETDSVDGAAGDILTKIVSKIKEKINSTIAEKNSGKNRETNLEYC